MYKCMQISYEFKLISTKFTVRWIFAMGSQNREIDIHEDCNAPATKQMRSVQRDKKAQSDFSQFRLLSKE